MLLHYVNCQSVAAAQVRMCALLAAVAVCAGRQVIRLAQSRSGLCWWARLSCPSKAQHAPKPCALPDQGSQVDKRGLYCALLHPLEQEQAPHPCQIRTGHRHLLWRLPHSHTDAAPAARHAGGAAAAAADAALDAHVWQRCAGGSCALGCCGKGERAGAAAPQARSRAWHCCDRLLACP